MTNVLLVEDDEEIARIIKYYLGQSDSYQVDWVTDGEQAWAAARSGYDVILLDIMLPGTDGIQLCARLREWYHCPILFISCLGDSETVIRALEQGGDDYIVKPFDNQVLHARIQANLRRARLEAKEPGSAGFSCPAFSLDTQNHVLRKGGEKIQLVSMESKLLAFFMQNPNRYFTAAELYKAIWGKPSYGDNRTVTVHIYTLRKKLEEDPSVPRYLKNVWGKGYFFDPLGGPEQTASL